MALTDRSLAALRSAAALLGVTPALSVRVRAGVDVLVEAMRPPFPPRDHPIMPACAFRRAVGSAHELRRRGEHLDMAGAEGADPQVDYGLRGGARLVVPGVVSVPHGEASLVLAAVPLPIGDVQPVALAAADDLGRSDLTSSIEVIADPVVASTVLAVSCRTDRRAVHLATDALTSVLASLAVAELEAFLAPADVPASPRRRRS